jgi:acyl-CoA synthetase (AMP-forming)/AMP-acid ligase II
MTLETLGGVLAGSLARAGDRVAVRAHGDIRTHRQVLDNAARLANALAGTGARPGDRVALMVSDQVAAVEAYLGCFLGGYVAVHVNDRLAAPEVSAILADADPRAFGYTPDLAEKVAGVEGLDAVPCVFGVGTGEVEHVGWDGLLGSGSPRDPQVPRRSDDLAIIGYTSGTTGRPKGVMHSQLTMLRALRHMPVHFDIRPRSRCAMTGTLSFVAGLWGVLLPHLYLGGEVSFMAGLAPDEWFARMLAEGSTVTYVPTPLAGAFVEQVRRHPQLLRTLRAAVHSGSQMPPDAVRAVVDAVGDRYGESYGMTETGAPVTRTEAADWLPTSEADDVYASAGRPVHIAEVAILAADGARLGPGETGEIAVRSDTQFVGYFHKPELTEESVVDGWLRTGDLGRLDAAGYLYVTDRAKDMIVSGGMNVYPAEVEAALAGLPGLAEIAVIGAPHERWGETVVAIAVARDADLDEAAVIAVARERLASYKKPTRVVFVPALPRTASLKIDKPELRRRWAAGELG